MVKCRKKLTYIVESFLLIVIFNEDKKVPHGFFAVANNFYEIYHIVYFRWRSLRFKLIVFQEGKVQTRSINSTVVISGAETFRMS